MNSSSTAENKSYRIYVGCLGSRLTENELKSLVEPFGNVKRINVVRDELTGVSSGYAFVEMSDEGEAARAIAKLGGKRINGHFLTARALF